MDGTSLETMCAWHTSPLYRMLRQPPLKNTIVCPDDIILAQFRLFHFCLQVKIQTEKVDFSTVSSRCGSLDNSKHRPGGGNVKVQYERAPCLLLPSALVGF